MTIQGYDLVGDIHGHADALHRLLRELNYAEIEGVFRHPEKQMIFVGDFIDRGPQQRRASEGSYPAPGDDTNELVQHCKRAIEGALCNFKCDVTLINWTFATNAPASQRE